MANDTETTTLFEVLIAVVLGLAAIGGGWAGYQSNQWGGTATADYGKAATTATKGSTSVNMAITAASRDLSLDLHAKELVVDANLTKEPALKERDLFVAKYLYTQKIFQRRFHDGQPLAAHARFWKWGSLGVLVAQLIPLVFMIFASWGLEKIETALIGDNPATIPWRSVMLVGPGFLVIGFVFVMWAARGLQAIKFLATYKVRVAAPPR